MARARKTTPEEVSALFPRFWATGRGWREIEKAASGLSGAEIRALLPLVPAAAAGVTGQNVARLRALLTRLAAQ